FTVGLVGKAVDQFEQLTTRAEQLGLGELLATVYAQIIQTLETRPREWGDPYTNYRGLNATGYGATLLPAGIRVEYAVHNTNPFVWISKLCSKVRPWQAIDLQPPSFLVLGSLFGCVVSAVASWIVKREIPARAFVVRFR